MGWIIFPFGVGWRDVGRTIHRGSFECPNPRCKGKRSSAFQQFRVRQYRNWAVLFYIPVLPLNRLGAGVQCTSCKSFFSLEALPEEELERLAMGVSYSPSSLAQAEDDGDLVDEEGREALPTAWASFTPRACPHCQAHMPRDASVCPSCERESTPWRFENGFWWTKGPDDAWYWLDEGAREWKRFEGEPLEQVDASRPDDGRSARVSALDPRPLIENATAALPAFVLVADATRPGLNEGLDVQWSDMGWLEPTEDEEILGRWICLRALCRVGVGESDGLPGALTGDSALESQLLFDGAGPLFLTNRRLVGWIGQGKTIFGPVGSKEALLYTLPLAVIEELDVAEETRGGSKETGIVVWNDEGGSLFADLSRWVDESRRAHPANRTEAARTIVEAVAAVQLETATPEQAAILERALEGAWEIGEDGDFEIELAPPGADSHEHEATAAPSEGAQTVSAAPETNADPVPALEATHADATDPFDEDGWGCPACGASNIGTHRFCTSCGAEREAAVAEEGVVEPGEDADSAELAAAAGCELCECVATPGEGDRFCRSCGHSAEAHRKAGEEAGLAVSLAACWSCDGPVAHGLSECPHCGVVLDQSWKESANAPGG